MVKKSINSAFNFTNLGGRQYSQRKLGQKALLAANEAYSDKKPLLSSKRDVEMSIGTSYFHIQPRNLRQIGPHSNSIEKVSTNTLAGPDYLTSSRDAPPASRNLSTKNNNVVLQKHNASSLSFRSFLLDTSDVIQRSEEEYEMT